VPVMLDEDIVQAAKDLLTICKRKNLLVATAESCTAGLVAGTLTEIPGVSSILDRGYITYSNEAKHEMLGVSRDILEQHGAVSPQTAEAMVRGVLGHSRVHLAVSVTGIAGPDGGSAEKPVRTCRLNHELCSRRNAWRPAAAADARLPDPASRKRLRQRHGAATAAPAGASRRSRRFARRQTPPPPPRSARQCCAARPGP